MYFERRQRPLAEDLADDTLMRVAETLEARGTIVVSPPVRFCYVMARFVLLEDLRRARRAVAVNEATLPVVESQANESAVAHELRLRHLDACLDILPGEQRQMLIEYYRDGRHERIERRRRLARQLGISTNALAIRAWRLRGRIEQCLDRQMPRAAAGARS